MACQRERLILGGTIPILVGQLLISLENIRINTTQHTCCSREKCFTNGWGLNFHTHNGLATYDLYLYIVIIVILVNYDDLTATSLESWLKREIIPNWPYFRLLKYDN